MSEWSIANLGWLELFLGLCGGWLLGRWWSMSMMTHYLKSKIPDKHGFRTGFWLAGEVRYIATGKEYGWMLANWDAARKGDPSDDTAE
jgi:hypothetical protein